MFAVGGDTVKVLIKGELEGLGPHSGEWVVSGVSLWHRGRAHWEYRKGAGVTEEGTPGVRSRGDPGGATNGPWCTRVWRQLRGSSRDLGAIPGLILGTRVRGALRMGRQHW